MIDTNIDTTMDHLINHLRKVNGGTKIEMEIFRQFVKEEDYDTDSVRMDIEYVDMISPNTYSWTSSNILINVCPLSSVASSMFPRAVYDYLNHIKCMHPQICFMHFIYFVCSSIDVSSHIFGTIY